jgi:hypothetical protein
MVPFGYGPASGTSFMIEHIGEVSEDEKNYGSYQIYVLRRRGALKKTVKIGSTPERIGSTSIIWSEPHSMIPSSAEIIKVRPRKESRKPSCWKQASAEKFKTPSRTLHTKWRKDNLQRTSDRDSWNVIVAFGIARITQVCLRLEKRRFYSRSFSVSDEVYPQGRNNHRRSEAGGA